MRDAAFSLRAAVLAVGATASALLAGTGGASAQGLLPLVESYRTPELAAELIADLRRYAPPDLAERAMVRPTYIPARGTWYRVVIGEPTLRSRVQSICSSLSTAGFRHCLPVPPGASIGSYSPGTGFLSFLGSFETRQSAEQLVDDVRIRAGHLLAGNWAAVRLVDVPERGWRYRVVIGPRTTQDGAEAICRRLWRVGFDPCFPILEQH